MDNIEHASAVEQASAGLIKNATNFEACIAVGRFHMQHHRAGKLIFEDAFPNLVFNAGKSDALDKYFAGSAYTAAWFMGLVDGGSAPTYNAADTSGSHAGWTESTAYSNANRVTVAWNAASATGGGAGSAGTGSKASQAAVFNINGTATIAGCFITTLNTKSGTTGITYSAGSFTAGNRGVINGDTLSVTWTGSN